MADKYVSSDRPLTKRHKPGNCILHMDASNMSSFVYLSEVEDLEGRFRSIINIRDQRLSQPLSSPNRMETICEKIPEDFGEYDGYHRDCYQNFTMNLNRLKLAAQSSNLERRSSQQKKSIDNILFEPDCIFCQQFGRKKVDNREPV